MRARLIALSLLAAAGMLSNAPVNADILRCIDATGNTLYTDSACPAGMRVVGAMSLPQSCTTEECERRRESDRKEAYERLRAEKEQLTAYTAQRHKRELDYRLLDEARYEAGLRSAQAMQAVPDEVVYPVYWPVGIPARCGRHCFAFPQHRRFSPSRIGDMAHHGPGRMKGPGTGREMRAAGIESRRPLRGTNMANARVSGVRWSGMRD